jgi:dephospho-CoA kinase
MAGTRCVIGILGGVGSGKSTLARIFAEFGATVVDADRIGHRVLDDPEIRRQIQAVWREDVLDSAGRVDRSRLAARVFSRPREMEILSRMVHPPILTELREAIRQAQGVVILDAALLAEFSLETLCDHLVFIETSPEARQARTVATRGWPPGEAARREGFQKPLAAKRQDADFVLDNNGSLDDLRAQARGIWEMVTRENRDDPDSFTGPIRSRE